jgi:hypothetical protein
VQGDKTISVGLMVFNGLQVHQRALNLQPSTCNKRAVGHCSSASAAGPRRYIPPRVAPDALNALHTLFSARRFSSGHMRRAGRACCQRRGPRYCSRRQDRNQPAVSFASAAPAGIKPGCAAVQQSKWAGKHAKQCKTVTSKSACSVRPRRLLPLRQSGPLLRARRQQSAGVVPGPRLLLALPRRILCRLFQVGC